VTAVGPPGDCAFTELSADGATLTIIVPLSIRTRGGRRLVVTEAGGDRWPRQLSIDHTIVKALARAFRWRKLLEESVYASSDELAAAEQINPSYVSRVLRLTLLAPDIVESILDDGKTAGLTMAAIMRPFPIEWNKQRGQLRTGRPRG
jgi:hypothetical protein